MSECVFPHRRYHIFVRFVKMSSETVIVCNNDLRIVNNRHLFHRLSETLHNSEKQYDWRAVIKKRTQNVCLIIYTYKKSIFSVVHYKINETET